VLSGVHALTLGAQPPSVTIAWETGSEENVAGFNLWRADARQLGVTQPEAGMQPDVGAEFERQRTQPDQARAQPGVQGTLVNGDLIPAEGTALTGASYSFTDRHVAPGATYAYQVEEVGLDGGRQRLPQSTMVQVADRRTPYMLLGALMVLLGVALAIVNAYATTTTC